MTSDVPSTSLQVASWNVYLGADLEPLLHASDEENLVKLTRAVVEQAERTRFGERADVIADVIGAERPDVVGLQELARWHLETPDGTETLWDHEQIITESLERRGHPYVMLHCSESFSGAVRLDPERTLRFTCCDAMLLRATPDREIIVHDAEHGHFEARVSADLPGLDEPIQVKRGWVRADLEVDGRRVRVHTTHLDASDEAIRRRQAHELVAVISSSPSPTVVVGDLNAAPGDATMDVLARAGYADAWAVAGVPGEPTWGPMPDLDGPRDLQQRLDHVLVDPQVVGVRAVRRLGVGDDARTTGPSPLWCSDHAGVLAEVVLP